MNGRLGDKLMLPRINHRMQNIDREREILLEETMDFLRSRAKRSQELYNPYHNYNYYPQNPNDFFNNMKPYRPIRYFFQRPVQLTVETAFPNQKAQIYEAVEHNRQVKEVTKDKKWGKPVKMDDLVKPADEVHYPIAKLISPVEFRKKQEEIENLKMQMDRVDPEKRRQLRQQNKRIWALMRKLRHFVKFYSVMKEFTLASKTLRKNKELILQASKADFAELSKFILEKVKGIENLAIDTLPSLFVYDKTLQVKTEDSVFRIKSFIHQIFHELQTNIALKEDIPDYIKKIMLNYISNGKYFPDNFLTTFEFNRLEFDIGLKTTRMNPDRQALIICFVLLYRVLILDILKNYRKKFLKLAKLRKKAVDSKDSSNKQGTVIESYSIKKSTVTSQKEDVKENIKYNMNFIIAILHSIIKDAFANTPKIYREYFKDTHLFKRFVINGETFNSSQSIENKLKLDEIELSSKLIFNAKANDFVKDNFRWVTMFKMTAFSFCMQFLENITN